MDDPFDQLGLQLRLLMLEEVRQRIFDLGRAYAAAFSRPPWNETYSLTMEYKAGMPSAPGHILSCAEQGGDIFVVLRQEEVIAFSIGIQLSDELCERYGLAQFDVAAHRSYYNLDVGIASETWERRGIGSALIHQRELRARERGCDWLYSRTRVDHDVQRHIYSEKLGYEVLGESQATTGGLASNRVYFRKRLSAG